MHPSDPELRSFVDVPPDSHFPIQNLPYGIFSVAADPRPRVGVAIGDDILDLRVLEEAGALRIGGAQRRVFSEGTLEPLLTLGRAAWREVRSRLSELLRADTAELRDNAALRERAFVARREATLHLPVKPRGYTDFYSSKEHATNVGLLFRDAKTALGPNWLELPVAYNGRASSVIASGTPVVRPNGQIKLPDAPRPHYGACRKLDFELEMAFVVGTASALGEPVAISDAERHIFGLVLLNDWSARDIQQWEYVPLGPFNSKTFATSISPWIVTLDALEPFRVAGPVQDPEPLSYLRISGDHNFDIELEVRLRPSGAAATTIARSNARRLYWNMAQQLAHHTVSGCNVQVGDLMGSGTISGPAPESRGCLLELTRDGREPLALPGGEQRSFLEDGDEVTFTGWCEGARYRVGFGEVGGTVLAARPL